LHFKFTLFYAYLAITHKLRITESEIGEYMQLHIYESTA